MRVSASFNKLKECKGHADRNKSGIVRVCVILSVARSVR